MMGSKSSTHDASHSHVFNYKKASSPHFPSHAAGLKLKQETAFP